MRSTQQPSRQATISKLTEQSGRFDQGSYEMADDYSRLMNVLGLVCNFAGVLILFRWGMPFRTASGGISSLALDGLLDEKGVALDRIYMVCGYVGLVLLVLGTMFQIIAALMPPTNLPK